MSESGEEEKMESLVLKLLRERDTREEKLLDNSISAIGQRGETLVISAILTAYTYIVFDE